MNRKKIESGGIMSTLKIIVDSACDLPHSYITEHNLELVPLTVHLNDEEYKDIVGIQAKKVYDEMRNGSVPKTSQASINQFSEVFTKYAQEGQACLYLAFSSELSGTYQTACMVREQVLEDYPEFDLTIIDTKAASLGLGLIVNHAVKLMESGATKETIIEEAKFYCEHMQHLFTVDNLEYLRRGGRVSNVSAFVGGLLNIKPLLHVEDGKLIPLEKIRGRKKVLKRILDLMGERGEDLSNQLIGISHADDEDTALQIKEMMEEQYGCKHFFINMIGSVIGAHTGPGAIAVFFLDKKANSDIDLTK